jgi:hypothetical protein
MLWNFTRTIRQDESRRKVFRNASDPEVSKTQRFADVSTGFDAWLQAYRKHLEEVCQRAKLPARAASRREQPTGTQH